MEANGTIATPGWVSIPQKVRLKGGYVVTELFQSQVSIPQKVRLKVFFACYVVFPILSFNSSKGAIKRKGAIREKEG